VFFVKKNVILTQKYHSEEVAMPKKKSRSIASRLARIRTVVHNALHSEKIKKAVAQYNYDEARLKEGMDLYKHAEKIESNQGLKQGKKLAASEIVNRILKKAKKLYMLHLKMARLILKGEPSYVQTLGLDGRRKRRVAGFMEEARQFYMNALSEAKIIQAFAGHGINKQDLEEGQKLIEELEQASADRDKKKGDWQQAVKERDAALEKAEDWVQVFLEVCRMALGEKRQQLMEALGVVVPSE
jgi:hypothetical protein